MEENLDAQKDYQLKFSGLFTVTGDLSLPPGPEFPEFILNLGITPDSEERGTKLENHGGYILSRGIYTEDIYQLVTFNTFFLVLIRVVDQFIQRTMIVTDGYVIRAGDEHILYSLDQVVDHYPKACSKWFRRYHFSTEKWIGSKEDMLSHSYPGAHAPLIQKASLFNREWDSHGGYMLSHSYPGAHAPLIQKASLFNREWDSHGGYMLSHSYPGAHAPLIQKASLFNREWDSHGGYMLSHSYPGAHAPLIQKASLFNREWDSHGGYMLSHSYPGAHAPLIQKASLFNREWDSHGGYMLSHSLDQGRRSAFLGRMPAYSDCTLIDSISVVVVEKEINGVVLLEDQAETFIICTCYSCYYLANRSAEKDTLHMEFGQIKKGVSAALLTGKRRNL
ncbi:hypothetical protein J6590_074310 [Homalodisca vitripennis]|nr:hypothetical protein J6590_074310 [Homalodisca vitripennis]